MTGWLPREHDGPRTLGEALGDLRTIAAAGELNDAHVIVVKSVGGLLAYRRGALHLGDRPEDPLGVRLAVDGELVADLPAPDFRGAGLRTFDGADYYDLTLMYAAIQVFVRDAYSGLGGLPAFDERADHKAAIESMLADRDGRRDAVAYLRTIRTFIEFPPRMRRRLERAIAELGRATLEDARRIAADLSFDAV